MIIVNNPFGEDPYDINEKNAAKRIGGRIREIRTALGLSQAELGEKVGLNADRVQKYENGARKPKQELLKKFAEALGVSTLALTDPVVDNYIGAMYAFFEMEKTFGLKVELTDGALCLSCGNGKATDNTFNAYLDLWERKSKEKEFALVTAADDKDRAAIEMDYKLWKWSFPMRETADWKEKIKQQRKNWIKSQINKLQQDLNALDEQE